MPEQTKKPLVIVGDVTLDWMFVNPGGSPTGVDYTHIWGSGFDCRAAAQPGGASLLHGLMQELVASDPVLRSGVEIHGPKLPAEALTSPCYDGLNRTWMSWAPHPRARGDEGDFAWRMVQFWGQCSPEGEGQLAEVTPMQGARGAILAIDDSNLGFRRAEAVWASLLDEAASPVSVLLKMTHPLAEGPLWSRLLDDYGDVLTVVVPINDLRKGRVQVGSPLSWERTTREVCLAVRGTGLHQARRVIVNLGPAGLVVVEREGRAELVFDPCTQEGDWEKERPGIVLGHATCVCAALLEAACRGDPDVCGRLAGSLRAMRALHAGGYDAVDAQGSVVQVNDETDARRIRALRFPYRRLARELASDGTGGFDRLVFDAVPKPSSSILADKLVGGDLAAEARRAAVSGPRSLPAGVPVETVGDWSSVDRTEIEGMRAVRNIVAGYAAEMQRGARMTRPLSIAVFGPPGAGKSYAVKQIAKVLLPGRLETLTFNLSQFRSGEDLPQAFHHVRDLVLAQALPLIFWDEFDTSLAGQPLGWLRHFLAPMQDGQFRDAGTFHPIGPAIFVFGGGTSSTYLKFAEARDATAEKETKKPDFVSRLKGFVNVFGPNPVGPADVAFRLRRAMLLRSLLRQKAPRLFDQDTLGIDEGLLNAFVEIDEYRNGARSMEAIVDTSNLGGRLRYERSSLPPEGQLELQVDARRFHELMEAGL